MEKISEDQADRLGVVGSRRERERAFRTQLVLEAAEKVFAERGFQAASVEEIAAQSEVAIATLYKMFGSKEAIFSALVDYRQDEFTVEVETFVRQALTPQRQVERLVQAVFGYFDRHQAAFRMYLGITHGFPWHIRSSFGERAFSKYRRFVSLVSEIIATGMKKGERQQVGPQRVAEAMIGALNGLLIHRHTSEPRLDVAVDARYATDLLLRLLVPHTPAAAPARRNRKADAR